jgi:hypothetical protein
MRETVEFRVNEEFASLLFEETEGVRLGEITRAVTLSTADPRYPRVGELQARLRLEHNRPFFFGWSMTRRYTAAELRAADYFSVRFTRTFEPTGEECGTVYDETQACRHAFSVAREAVISGNAITLPAYTCGVGARQVTPLTLNGRRVPRGKDFARTIANEEIASERAKEILERAGVTGATFEPVRFQRSRPGADKWYQLMSVSPPAEIVVPTIAGIEPFDHDSDSVYRCPYGHVIGLNLLSEVSIARLSGTPMDLIRTHQCVGARVGLLRPRSILLVSQRVRQAVLKAGLKGWQFEVVHIV